MHKSNLKFRSMLLLGAAAMVGMSFAANADDAQKVETVVVTGSRIATTNAMADAPVSFVSADAIKQTKAVTLEQVFNKLPAVSQTGSNDQNSISPGGMSTVDLRGLGDNRTLVLINGQRMVSTFGNGGQGQDMANVPMSMIDHIEVLKDGASPIYGADAIGGVINIITKQNFTGLQLDASGGISGHGDHASQSISATMGVASDKANIIFSLDYSSEDPVRQSARKWAHGKYTTSSYVPNAQYIGETSGDYYSGGSGDIASEDSWQSFNTGKRSDLIQGRGIFNATINANYKITPHTTLFLESYFTNRKSSAVLNPEPVGASATTAKWMSGTTIPTTNVNNTTGETLDVYKRLTEVGNRIFNENNNTFQERLGAKGDIHGWAWDVGYMYGESDSQDIEKNAINLSKLQQLIGNSDCDDDAPDNCGSVTLAASGDGALTSDDVDYIAYTSNESSRYVQQIFYADISGELPIALQGGNIGLALGINYRGEDVRDTPDSVAQNGDSAESNSAATAGNYNVKGVYGEVKLPVLANKPFAQELSFDVSGRYSYYSTSGHGTVYAGKVNWAVNDSIRFRAGYGTGERAPQVGAEMYLGDTASADSYTDPCESATDATVIANCTTAGAYTNSTTSTFSQAAPQLTAIWEGNPDLKPEKSIQYNFGVVLTPSFAPGLSVTVDYYNIHLKDMIGMVSPADAIRFCYKSDEDMSTNVYCQNFGDRNASGQMTTYYEKYMNLGWEHTDGIDYSIKYNTDALAAPLGLPDGTVFAFGLDGVWLNNMKQQNLDGSTTQYAGKWVDDAVSVAYPKYKGNLSADMYLPSGASVGFTERFISALSIYDRSEADEADMHAPMMWYTDFATTIPYKNYTATFGIDNLLDKDPPLMHDYYVQTISSQYDMVGRYFYLRLGAKF